MENALYMDDSYLKEFEAIVESVKEQKFVVLEKIMGCLRSEQGKKTTQIMMSLFGTWRLQGLNPYKELMSIL